MKKNISAFTMISGTIIGVGMFGLPYAAAQVGFLPVVLVYFPVLTLITLVIHLIFGEICLRTEGVHRLPGYSKIYLGQTGAVLSVISATVGLLGSMVAYLIIGGDFLGNILIPLLGGQELTYILIFFAAGALIIYTENKGIARAELVGLILLLGTLVYLFSQGFSQINFAHFFTYSGSNLFLPYGIILFSLGGLSVIPEIKDMLASDSRRIKSIITAGIILPALVYIAFIYLVLGITGANTTQDALSGLKMVLGEKIMITGFIVGVIATFTSYLTVGQTLKKVFWYDLKFPHFNAWIIACFVPLILYFIGLNDFIMIIGFLGTVTIAIDAVLIFLIFQKAKTNGRRKPEYEIKLAKILIYALIGLFLTGAAIQISQMF
jgi:tyrosine-specific transport protein